MSLPKNPSFNSAIHSAAQPSMRQPGILTAILALHAVALILFMNASTPHQPAAPIEEPTPLKMVLVEPMGAPIVKPAGFSHATLQQPVAMPIEHQPERTERQAKTPQTQSVVSPRPIPLPAKSQPVAGLPSISSAQSTTGSTQAADSDRGISVPVAAASASAGGGEKNAVHGDTKPAVAPAAGAGDPTTPPRFGVSYLNNPPPKYPPIAKRQGEQGKVLLRVLVSAAGAAQQVLLQVSSGHSTLDDSALKAVRQWRFIPAQRGGDAVDAWVQVPVVFKLD